MRKLLENFWARLILVFVLLGGVYLFAALLPQLRERAAQQLPQKPLVSFRAAVNQNYIALQALGNYSGTDKATALSLNTAEANARNSYNAFASAMKNIPEQVDPKIVTPLKEVANEQSELFDTYRGRFTALSKPLEYLPQDDIQLSNIAQAVARAKAASQALRDLSNTGNFQLKNEASAGQPGIAVSGSGGFTLSSRAKQALRDSASCFNQLASQIENKSASAKSTLARCDKGYTITRSQVTKVVTEPLRTGKGAQIQAKLLDAIKQLNSQLNI